MKKLILGLVVVFGLGLSVSAQTWQGQVSHNGYSVYSLGSLVDLSILAMIDSEDPSLVHIKMRIPYRYDGGTAWADCNGTAVALHYKDGWAYFDYYYNGKGPEYVFTFYKNNNTSDKTSEKKKIYPSLQTLRPKQRYGQKKYTTYW